MLHKSLLRNFLFLGMLLSSFFGFSQPVSQTFNSNGTYVVPAGYTAQITVEAWAGGAGGGSGSGNERGGGGGGAYARSTLNVTAGSYTVTVGTGGSVGVNGGNSIFGSNVVVAAGGTSTGSATGGAGGTTAASIGTLENAGGSGGNGFNAGAGGGGGGSATTGGPGLPGDPGTATTGGAGGIGEGNGGAGANDSPATDAVGGTAPGGGGGGRAKNNGTNSAAGAAGRVIVAVVSFALPIELKSFTGTLDKQNITLSFSTATERNNAYFSIERSTDGARFAAIGKVTGAGNSDLQQDYSYTDERPVKGVNFYRLQQVDFDGQFSYSPVVSVTFGQAGGIRLSPQPVLDQLTVALEQPTAEATAWQVYDFAGRLLQSGTLDAETTNFDIPTVTLSEGSYVLRLVSGPTVLTQQFQKR